VGSSRSEAGRVGRNVMTKVWRENHRVSTGCLLGLSAMALGLLIATPAGAWVDLCGKDPNRGGNKIHVTDGSYVMNVGELQVNITNFGPIGSHFSSNASWSDAPSAQWPAGSGNEYLWAAGLWVAGVQLGERLCSTAGGQVEWEFRPLDDLEDTIYEAIGGHINRPPGNPEAGGARAPEGNPNDDGDEYETGPLAGQPRIDEETLNGYDDDEDGLIDEDFAQIGNQMMVCTMYDNTRLAQEREPDHTPMQLKLVQQSYAWENDNVDDFVGFEFFITNIGVTPITQLYIGFFADSDIGPRGQANLSQDDRVGSYEGLVRASDNSFVPVSVGFMYDNAKPESGVKLDGYFGILFLGHDTDPTGRRAPETVKIRSFQHFDSQKPFDAGGDPQNDGERYQAMSWAQKDQDANKDADYRFLISAGPFLELEPDETLSFQAAMVVGPGLSGLLSNCAEAALTYYGIWYNADDDAQTGINGRETKVCLQDFGDEVDRFWNIRPDFGDTSCVTQEFLLQQPHLTDDDTFTDEDGKTCTWVNLDNCFECSRQKGAQCTKQDDIKTIWNCWDPQVVEKVGCTGIDGNESQIHWLVGMAPPPPGMRVWPSDNAVHIFWDDRSEHTVDIRLQEIDFESYRIWRADNWDRPFGTSVENGPQSNLWQLIAEYDVVNNYVEERTLGNGSTVEDTLALGRNTGLEAIRYRPRVLDDERFNGLAEAMQQVVDSDTLGLYIERPALYDANGDLVAGLEPLQPWSGYPAALDTFFMVASREVAPDSANRPKRGVKFYEYIDRDIHNGLIYFYSVTATDHTMDSVGGHEYRTTGPGLVGDPGSSFLTTIPGTDAQTAEERAQEGANIYVYPNPATREALEDFQQLFPNSDDPTGVRIAFANLPQAKNLISIFTLDGDLVAEVEHDGSDGYGQAFWNLVSRNGQEVSSGIYLYTVASEDKRFEDYIGKFVLIR
jgi:hypothetical protein